MKENEYLEIITEMQETVTKFNILERLYRVNGDSLFVSAELCKAIFGGDENDNLSD